MGLGQGQWHCLGQGLLFPINCSLAVFGEVGRILGSVQLEFPEFNRFPLDPGREQVLPLNGCELALSCMASAACRGRRTHTRSLACAAPVAGARPRQDPPRRSLEDMGWCPHRQEPGLLRTRCGRCGSVSTLTGSPWRMWGRVHMHRSLASSGPAAGGEGEEKPPERGPLRGCKLTGPRGGGVCCVDAGVSVALCAGRARGCRVSPLWAQDLLGGPRVRVYALADSVPRAPQAVCSQAAAAHPGLVLPQPRACRVLPASTPGQGCRFGVWKLGSSADSADGCGESSYFHSVGSSTSAECLPVSVCLP